MNRFFTRTYETLLASSWTRKALEFCRENPIVVSAIGGLTLLVIFLLCVNGNLRKTAKRAKIDSQQAQEQAQAQVPSPVAENEAPKRNAATLTTKVTPIKKAEQKEAPTPKAEMKPEAKATAPQAEEKTEAKATAPQTKEKKQPKATSIVKHPEEEEIVPPTATFTVKQQKMKKSKTAKKGGTEKMKKLDPHRKLSQAEEIEETLAMVENMDEDTPEFLRDHYDEGDTDRIAKLKGKWVICRILTDQEGSEEAYFFELHASNGEKLLTSEDYTSYQGALRGLETHKTNILNGNLKITLSKKGDYIFKLVSGKNLLLCMGENYPTKARCESAIASTVRFAATAIIDENVQDIVIKVPREDDSPIPPLPDGYNGKWIISSKLSAEGDRIYFFELFANNGEKLLSSEEYTTYIGAVNGIETHKKNIAKNNFRISLTKRGDYIYKLLNANDQLLCLGEHYKTKRLCQNAVESVKRFAMSSPMLTDVEQQA